MFKVGDKVKIIGNGRGNFLADKAIITSFQGHEMINESVEKIWNCMKLNNKDEAEGFQNCINEGDLELINNNMNLKEKFLLALTKEPDKSLRKAGITNGDDLLTEEGKVIYDNWRFRKDKEEFVKDPEIAKILKDDEKKKE